MPASSYNASARSDPNASASVKKNPDTHGDKMRQGSVRWIKCAKWQECRGINNNPSSTPESLILQASAMPSLQSRQIPSAMAARCTCPCWNSSEDQPRLQPEDVTKFHTSYSCYGWNLRGNVSRDKFWNGLSNICENVTTKSSQKSYAISANWQNSDWIIISTNLRSRLPPGSLPTCPWPIHPPHPPSKPTCVHKQSLGDARWCRSVWLHLVSWQNWGTGASSTKATYTFKRHGGTDGLGVDCRAPNWKHKCNTSIWGRHWISAETSLANKERIPHHSAVRNSVQWLSDQKLRTFTFRTNETSIERIYACSIPQYTLNLWILINTNNDDALICSI